MWNNFGDITKRLAEKAAAAAENIEGQLNQSVGATPDVLAANAKKKLSLDDGNAFECAVHGVFFFVWCMEVRLVWSYVVG